MMSRFLVFPLLSCFLVTGKLFAQELDFSHEVVPILTQHCIECHGAKEAKGSFSLNTRQLLVDSGYIDKDAPADSELLKLVKSNDAEHQMPPKEKPRLSAKEILILEKWIAANMPWEAADSKRSWLFA